MTDSTSATAAQRRPCRMAYCPNDVSAPDDLCLDHRQPATAATMQDALDAIQALADALDRTQANFVSAVNGRPVRDMCENLAENHAAALKGARLMPMPSTLMRQP